MSTSSGKQTPSLKNESAKQVSASHWDQFTALVEDVSRAEFATWLDEELIKLEKDLDQFVTSRSRYSGRR
ncbi:hypothetical protein Mal15_52200 [Stieleria maiorica]|uniref:Uncharacterized protein n=1 Tax=Stieleria maiorica TaxID=2795974 RepID=A0A5B9MJT8_9BACT|nr:hypothetical protein [Stieleria maiorica]QEG01144.1 hypothetical protein Mal15_52200 [Stieleria maiorica]